MLSVVPPMNMQDSFIQEHYTFIIWTLFVVSIYLTAWLILTKRERHTTSERNVQLIVDSLQASVSDQQRIAKIQNVSLSHSLEKLESTIITLNNTVEAISEKTTMTLHAHDTRITKLETEHKLYHTKK